MFPTIKTTYIRIVPTEWGRTSHLQLVGRLRQEDPELEVSLGNKQDPVQIPFPSTYQCVCARMWHVYLSDRTGNELPPPIYSFPLILAPTLEQTVQMDYGYTSEHSQYNMGLSLIAHFSQSGQQCWFLTCSSLPQKLGTKVFFLPTSSAAGRVTWF